MDSYTSILWEKINSLKNLDIVFLNGPNINNAYKKENIRS